MNIQIYSERQARLNDLLQLLSASLRHYDSDLDLPDEGNSRSCFSDIHHARSKLLQEWQVEIQAHGTLPNAIDDDQQWLQELKDHAYHFLSGDPHCLIKLRLKNEQQLQAQLKKLLQRRDINPEIRALITHTHYHVIRSICLLQDQVNNDSL